MKIIDFAFHCQALDYYFQVSETSVIIEYPPVALLQRLHESVIAEDGVVNKIFS